MKTVKIFLASSNELVKDREDFAEFITQRSDLWKKENITLELKKWERESTAMSATHSQDEYNKLIPECDLLVVLAHTKMGKFTREEFEVGYEQFKSKRNPLIFPYFRKLDDGAAAENSLGEFRERLKECNYFAPADYTHFSELATQFWGELERFVLPWRSDAHKLDLPNKVFILSPLEDQPVIENILLPYLKKAEIPLHLDFRNFTLDNISTLSQTVRTCRKTLLISSTNVSDVGRLFVKAFRQEYSEEIVREKLLPLQLSGSAQFPDLPADAFDISNPASLEQNLQALVGRLRHDFGLEVLKKNWPPLPPEFVDARRLPQGGVYVQLFGRQQELALLDRCWEENEVRILSFTANGGVGKSQLVNRWVNDMEADNFRGAERVFAWTFYSQGTGDKTTSADRFIQTALEWFGDADPLLGSPWERGKRLAALAAQHRSLILLDGLEPLQYPADLLRGKLKDPALEMFLKTFARQSQGLCVVTTRVPLAGLERAAERLRQHDLELLSPEACSIILRTRGVSGSEEKIRKTALDFGCHALAINLLAEYLHALPEHPVEAAEAIADLPDVPVEKGKHPRRVIEALFRQLLAKGKNDEARVLPLLGLFDRAVPEEVLETVITPKSQQFNLLRTVVSSFGFFKEKDNPPPLNVYRVLSDLRRAKLLYEESSHAPDEVDCHPLIREHFEDYLQKNEPELYRAAHERLYEYYKNLPEKELPDTLEEMEPLFYAIAHGCRAGKQKAAFKVYWERINRQTQHYASRKLGAYSSQITALACFFECLWDKPSAKLAEIHQAALLGWVGYRLRTMGKLIEADQPMRACLKKHIEMKNWEEAALSAVNLSEFYLIFGNIQKAILLGRDAIVYAERGEDKFYNENGILACADALHNAGDENTAMLFFEEAEQMLQKRKGERFLFSFSGFQYCECLLSKGRCEEVLLRAENGLSIVLIASRNLLDFALNHLSLGKAYALLFEEHHDLTHQTAATKHLDTAVIGLEKAGRQDYLPLGLLARAAWYRYASRYAEAYEDLEEVLEIAESGGMRLYLVDYHIEMARLLQAAPTPSPSPEKEGSAAWHKAEALRLIGETGYKRRLKEAEAL